MKTRITLLAAALTLGLSACNNQDPANDTTGLDVETTAVEQGPANARDADASTTDDAMTGAGQLADVDRQALMTVEAIDAHEIAASEDALAKNVEGDLRAYAETLRDDHTRNLDATRRLLDAGVPGEYAAQAARTPAVTGSTEASPPEDTHAGAHDERPADPGIAAMRQQHDAARKRLAALDGDAFAAAWLEAMVKGHEDALTKIDALLPTATHEGVGRHLRDTREAVAAHLDTARELQKAR